MRIVDGKNLAHRTAAVVADEIDLVDLQRVEEVRERGAAVAFTGIRRHGILGHAPEGRTRLREGDLVLIHGRPLAIPQLAEKVPAILDAWYVGQEGGTAIGEILFGDVNPSGKLPVTLPRSVGQLPVYYNRKPTSFRNFNDSTRDPLFVFGHGLSYTTFALAAAKVEPATIKVDGQATVTVEVSNTGARAGDEVVQQKGHVGDY